MAMRNWITPAGTGPSGTVDEGRRAKLPQANIPVANRTSHGTIRANATTGGASRRMAPSAPPMRLIANSARNERCCAPLTKLRAASPDVTWPGNKRHRGRDVGCARIEPRQDEGGQGDERSASGKRVLRARPKPGENEQEKHRRTMRDVLPGEKKARSSALSGQASLRRP